MNRFVRATTLAFLLFPLFTTADARANGGQTHGGTAVVCRSVDGTIARAEVLDLFEARELLGVRPMRILDAEWARTAVFWGLRYRYQGRSTYADYLELATTEIRYRFRFLDAGKHLPLIPDVFPKLKNLGVCPATLRTTRNDQCTMQWLLDFDSRCAIEQLASYDDDGALLVDREIYDALDPINQLALELHEGAYYLDRKYRRATNSAFARELVGLLLADRPDPRLDSMIAAYVFWIGEKPPIVPFTPGSI